MKSVHILLNRESSYSGLGLIATSSAMIGPLSLEVIYNHADLWFSDPWQDSAFYWIWLVWTGLGLCITAPWGLDRKFHGLSREVHLSYSLYLSMIGVATYILFGLPTWLWLHQISLVDFPTALNGQLLSISILGISAALASLAELKFSSLLSMVGSILIGLSIIYGVWSWFGAGSS